MILAVLSAKGGTGKSTIALNLSGVLASQNQRVLLIDADPQGSVARWSKTTKQKYPDVMVHPSPIIKKDAKKAGKKYDLTIFDSPPTFKRRMRCLIRASDLILIPVSPGVTDLWSTRKLVEIYLEEKEKRPSLEARLLINRIDRRTKIGREFRSNLEKLSIPVFITEIPQRVVYPEAWQSGVTVDRLQSNSTGMKDFQKLAAEVLIWINKYQQAKRLK